MRNGTRRKGPSISLALSVCLISLATLCTAPSVRADTPATTPASLPAPLPVPISPAQPASSNDNQNPADNPLANIGPQNAGADFTYPIPRRPAPAHGWDVDGDLDGRFRSASSGRTDRSYINEGELDLGHPIYWKGRYQGTVFAQIIAENVPDASGGKGRVSDVAFGEAYVTYHLPIQTQTGSTAYLRVGQFTLPVGLLSVYDTHLQIMQTLAPLGIGESIDWGAELQGRFNGIIDYGFAITSGNGADRVYLTPNGLLSFRLGRLLATPWGSFNVGGSLLSGRLPLTEVDPVTGFAPLIPPSGKISAPFGYVNKTRIVGDGTWTYRTWTVRGEAMTGADNSTTVDGYFLMGEYRFAPGLSAIAARTYWDYGHDNSTSADNSAGIDIDYGNNLVVRCLYEERRDVPYLTQPATEPMATTHLRHIFTIQTVVRF